MVAAGSKDEPGSLLEVLRGLVLSTSLVIGRWYLCSQIVNNFFIKISRIEAGSSLEVLANRAAQLHAASRLLSIPSWKLEQLLLSPVSKQVKRPVESGLLPECCMSQQILQDSPFSN